MGANSAPVCILTGLISGAPTRVGMSTWQEPNKVCEAILVYYSSLDEVLREKD